MPPNELELIALQTEFDLYLTFVKRLIINLPDAKDRTRAALWLKKLRDVEDNNFKKLRNEHLKLLLFALHRRALVGLFQKSPPEGELETFHDGLNLTDMTKELIELAEKKLIKGDDGDGPQECPLPAVATNFSHDLKEYAATQVIPKFGSHVYYAVSNEPVQLWTKSANQTYPGSGDVPNNLQWEHIFAKLTDHVLEKQAAVEALFEEKEEEVANVSEEDEGKINLDLPKLEVTKCPGKPTFRWKPGSLLNMYQSYDFSDVGVAEDLEAQGKYQLELDEQAFSFLDQTIPGRQLPVLRSPYLEDLPPDILERRHHGIWDEIPEQEDEYEEFCVDEEEEECEDEDEDADGKNCPCSAPPTPTRGGSLDYGGGSRGATPSGVQNQGRANSIRSGVVNGSQPCCCCDKKQGQSQNQGQDCGPPISNTQIQLQNYYVSNPPQLNQGQPFPSQDLCQNCQTNSFDSPRNNSFQGRRSMPNGAPRANQCCSQNNSPPQGRWNSNSDIC